jgi:hypothetical protein
MKTAVEWLEEKLKESLGEDFDAVRGYFVMAKEMEMEQMDKVAEDFYYGSYSYKKFEQYYNETYGGEK